MILADRETWGQYSTLRGTILVSCMLEITPLLSQWLIVLQSGRYAVSDYKSAFERNPYRDSLAILMLEKILAKLDPIPALSEVFYSILMLSFWAK